MLIRTLPLLVMLLPSLALAQAKDPTDFSDLAGTKKLDQTLSDMNKKNDSCVYAEPAEVEKLLGEKLAAPPFRLGGGRPDGNGTDCRYLTASFHAIDIGVTRMGGDKLFETLTGVNMTVDRNANAVGSLNKTLGLEGEWDEIRLLGGYGLAALRGDLLVTVKLRGIHAKPEDVAPLINAIYKRLDKPLPIDGAAGIPAALALDAKRPPPRDACSLLKASDVEKAFGAAPLAPKPQNAGCEWRSDDGKKSFAYKVTWRDVYAEFESLHALAGGVTQANAELPAGPWEFGYKLSIMRAVVRHDVMVQAVPIGLNPEQTQALLGTIVQQF